MKFNHENIRMSEKQTTIAKSVSLSGTGLHTGNQSTIRFNPAPAGYGYKFVRTDLPGSVEIPALTDYVVDLSRGTTIGIDEVKVHTVEHVLAALVGLKIDNCMIELSANEPPVTDGSSMPYVEVLMEAGITTLEEDRQYFEIDTTIRYNDEEKGVEIVALPNENYRLTVMVDYANPALGSQHTGLFDMEKEFVKEFASARTFCFLHELVALHNEGLIKGGSLESAIVIVDKQSTPEELKLIEKIFNLDHTPVLGETGILDNRQLRFRNEPARHKLLDMIGDLALVGVPLKGQILAARPGHRSNFEFAKKIRQGYLKAQNDPKRKIRKSGAPFLDINQVKQILPHRYPFLLIDKVLDFNEKEQSLVAMKNVTANEEFFNGHFPERPVMPGVLQIEAMAQASGVLIKLLGGEKMKSTMAFFMGIKEAKFRRPVLPGDTLVIHTKILQKRFNTYSFKTTAYVNEAVVAEAELQTALVD